MMCGCAVITRILWWKGTGEAALNSCTALRKLLNLSEPQSPLEKVALKSLLYSIFRRLNEFKSVQQTCGCQGRGVGIRTGSLGLTDANCYLLNG